jgi:hypothetical protein
MLIQSTGRWWLPHLWRYIEIERTEQGMVVRRVRKSVPEALMDWAEELFRRLIW